MTHKARARAKAQAFFEMFQKRGASPVEAEVFQDARLLLDLYGEDIRARAYTVMDPVHGEQMLRPDFTVPVTQMHMHARATPAEYTYMGEVFRRQEDHPERRNAYFQVGYEIFDLDDPAGADASVFCAMLGALEGVPLAVATSDINVIVAAVHALQTTPERTSALLRHLWRPHRFRALLHRYAQPQNIAPERVALLDQTVQEADVVGMRGADEINQRLASLRADYHATALAPEQIALMDHLLDIKTTAPKALDEIRALAVDMPQLTAAANGLEARLEAIEKRRQDVAHLPYEQSYGRTTMEYYDGFVFGFFFPDAPELPAVVTGGRYDALTKRLGQGDAIAAVGAVIRPDVLVDWEDRQNA